MTEYNSLNVKLSDSQLNKLKSAIKNETGVVLRISSSMVGNSNDNTNFPHKLLLSNRQVANIRKAFSNNLSTDVKFSKTQLLKMMQSGGFLGNLLSELAGPLMKVAMPLAKNVIALLGLTAAMSAIDGSIKKKMLGLGFSKSVTLWFKSYLSNRKFKVNLNQTFSEPGDLLCGVPQGSILGPLLFLLYINDMPQSVNCELLLYADDTCLIFQHNDIKEIETQLNKNFSLICDWFVDNKLSIHFGEDKTKSILFSSKRKI